MAELNARAMLWKLNNILVSIPAREFLNYKYSTADFTKLKGAGNYRLIDLNNLVSTCPAAPFKCCLG